MGSARRPLVGTESWVHLGHPRQVGRTQLEAGRDRAHPENTHCWGEATPSHTGPHGTPGTLRAEGVVGALA